MTGLQLDGVSWSGVAFENNLYAIILLSVLSFYIFQFLVAEAFDCEIAFTFLFGFNGGQHIVFSGRERERERETMTHLVLILMF